MLESVKFLDMQVVSVGAQLPDRCCSADEKRARKPVGRTLRIDLLSQPQNKMGKLMRQVETLPVPR